MKKIYIHHHSTLSSNIFVFFAMTNYRLNLILTILPCTTLELCPFYYFQFCHFTLELCPLIIFNFTIYYFDYLLNFAIYYTGVMSFDYFLNFAIYYTTLIIFSILPFTTLELCPIFNFVCLESFIEMTYFCTNIKFVHYDISCHKHHLFIMFLFPW